MNQYLYRVPASQSGFTLIELMIVVVIMAILATVAMPLRELMVKREKEQVLRTGLRQIRGAIDAYKQAVDDGRIKVDDGRIKVDDGRIKKIEEKSGYPARLEDLFIGVTDSKNSEKKYIFFLRRLPRDPMFQDLDVAGVERTPDVDTWGKRSYESPPDNPQEGEDVFDVFSRSEFIGLNGIPYNKW
jgi:general secretion pathway protein G